MVIEAWNDIKQKKFSSIYLLYGKETFLMNETKQLLLNNVLNKEEIDFNLSNYDLEETPIEVAMEDAETLPFMGDFRLIFLHNPVFLTAEKTKEKVEHQVAVLEKYIKEPVPYTILVFVAPYEKLDERKKITKELKRVATIIEAKKLNETQLMRWVRDKVDISGIKMEDQVIEQLLLLTGTNLMNLANELDKLLLYASDDKEINAHMVEMLVCRSLEQNIFTLVEEIIHRRIEGALRIYYDLLKQNEEPLKILAIIASQFRLIYQVKELSRQGYGQQKIASSIKVHPFRVKLAASQATMFTGAELAKIMNRLADIDYQMKTGQMNKELLIELFLFHLHNKK